MNLSVLASGSKGNCYILQSNTECLVLECGIPFKAVKQALSFDILKIVGVVGSHSHKDHMGYAEEYLKCGIPVYASEETHKSISREYQNQTAVKCGYWYKVGGFEITPFSVEHDVECFGYIIKHEEIGTLLFATDTSFIKSNFKKLAVNHILIEANYSEEIINDLLSKGLIDESRVNRTFKTHMSIETCKGFIEANKTTNLDSVLLIHLSDSNSDAALFKKEIQDIVGDNVNVLIAERGVSMNLNICPF